MKLKGVAEEGDVDMTLKLDCWSDDLSPAQLAAFEKAEKEHKDVMEKLNEILKESGGEKIYLGDIFSAYTVPGPSPSLEAISKPLGVVRKEYASKKAVEEKKLRQEREVARKREYKQVELLDEEDEEEYLPLSKRSKAKLAAEKKKEPEKKVPVGKGGKSSAQHSISSTPPSVPSTFRPTETTSIGGLTVGVNKKKEIVDLTKDDNTTTIAKVTADSREISFNKLQGKTFPSLVVLARPSLKVKDNVNDRPTLDAKVKGVLMHTATKFTEWLIQQGLVRSEQGCLIHKDTNLKLGMYSDATKFPYSGGYVWISECCPTRFVSVFSGSLFEGASNPPAVLLKLIYHWSCQTNVQNVVQWVKVDNLYVKELYSRLRAVCTVAVHRHMNLLGGAGKKIEVGVISLGTTTQDGQQRQVKVEVLGVLDNEAKIVRLRAVEPLSDGEKNFKKRFAKILEPLSGWVSKDSQIITDLTVDKATLHGLGYKSVIQSTNNDPNAKNTNAHVMDYLRRIVPRMFQNTLSLLSRQIIQQFLDELVWREWYGTTPGTAFDNIVSHISEQTRVDVNDSLVRRLNNVSVDPFKNWAHLAARSSSSATPSTSSGKRTGRPPKHRKEPSPEYIPPPKKVIKEEPKKYVKTAPKVVEAPVKEKEPTIYLEQYYYGVHNQELANDSATPVNFKVKCLWCEDTFSTNITLMNHVKGHANETTDLNVQCLYCLEYFGDRDKLAKHHVLAHPVETKNTFNTGGVECIICEARFSTNTVLSNHMQKTHCPADLPYRCGCCDFATSALRYAVDHFYINHADSGILQCPFCLQIYGAVDNTGKILSNNIVDYLEHMKFHMNKAQCKKCNRCATSFTTKGALRVHQLFAHQSQQYRGKKIQTMCKHTAKIAKPKFKNTTPKDNSITYLSKYHNVSMFIDNGHICLECNADFEETSHITGNMSCNKCKYRTCCLRAIMEHVANCGGNTNQETTGVSPLEKEMHCICGFSSSEGNALARHLATCDRRSAYASSELVNENTVKRNMLDMLGLVRRDDESESDDLLKPVNENDRPQEASVESEEDQQPADTEPADTELADTEPPEASPLDTSEINTQLSFDDLAPASVAPQQEPDRTPTLRDEYQPLATPRVAPVTHEPNDMENVPMGPY